MLNSSIQNLLQQAINVHDKESDLVLIKSDADGIKSACLEVSLFWDVSSMKAVLSQRLAGDTALLIYLNWAGSSAVH
jgi:hypothetical protein